MHINDIRGLLHKAPFTPFSLELSNAIRVKVGHPEIVAIPRHGRFLVVAGDHVEILEPSQIAAAILNRKRKASTL